ncbi:signal peptidase I [Evansella sp. AB-rgal1]|uniref:signal peptidase I n=1 Tax=Evansella sp. AB-rgal1 TaxID=3242696 RepID=UPI00359D3554
MIDKIFSEIYNWSKAIIFAFVFAVLINVFVVQPYTVDGSSMEPTLNGIDHYDDEKKGDRVVAFKTPFILGSSPKAGDIVIVNSEVDNQRTWKDLFLESPVLALFIDSDNKETNIWIKRVIGEPGDTLEVRNGYVYRNGTLLNEDYIKEEMFGNIPEFIVPEDTVFVMGDNRNGSKDSRSVGPIPTDNVIGKVIFRYFPFEKMDYFN